MTTTARNQPSVWHFAPTDTAAGASAAQHSAAPGAAPPISACIITFNEADRIADCIRSVDWCNEVLVVDSHSTDDTRELAASLGARVIERDWPGYRSQKEFAVQAAAHDWILSLDADERVTPQLAAEMRALQQQGLCDCAGISMPRTTDYFGHFLRRGNPYPDREIRFFDRRRGGFRGHEVHESIRVRGPVRALQGEILHFSYRSYADHRQRMQRYAQLMADAMAGSGRRVSWWHLTFNPAWRFVRGYLLRGGFTEGWRGFVHGIVEAGYVRDKYLLAYVRRRQRAVCDRNAASRDSN